MHIGLGELLVVAVVGISILVLLLSAGLPLRHDATKTVKGNVSAEAVFQAISARIGNLGRVKESDPLIVEGFNSSLEGACQTTEVTFSVRASGKQTIILAEARQRPSSLAWVVGLVGLYFYVLPGFAVAFWFLLSKAMVQRQLWRILDEVAEELDAPIGDQVSQSSAP